MAYNDGSEYPKGRAQATGLSSTPTTLIAATDGITKIAHVVLSNAAIARTVTLRAVDDSPVYYVIRLAANSTFVVPSFTIPAGEGLEILTDNATADVNATVAYYNGA